MPIIKSPRKTRNKIPSLSDINSVLLSDPIPNPNSKTSTTNPLLLSDPIPNSNSKTSTLTIEDILKEIHQLKLVCSNTNDRVIQLQKSIQNIVVESKAVKDDVANLQETSVAAIESNLKLHQRTAQLI